MSISSRGFDLRSPLFFGVPFFSFSHIFVWRRVVSQPRTSRTWYIFTLYDVLGSIYLTCIYAQRVLLPLLLLCVLLYCCCCCSCSGCSSSCPDGEKCCSIESDSCVFFLFIQTRYIFYVPLGSTVAFTASICLHCSTFSIITGMHGAKAEPSLYIISILPAAGTNCTCLLYTSPSPRD